METLDDTTALARRALGLRSFAASLACGRDPEDLVQEAALSALRSPVPSASALPWLRRVLRNHAYQRHRGEQRRLRRETSLVEESTADAPEQALFRAQLLATLGQALAELDEPYRHTMQQRFVEGLSAAEIARKTKTPATTVRSRIQHALDQIRGVLDDRFGGRAQWCPALMIVVQAPASAVTQPSVMATVSSASKGGGGAMIKTSMMAVVATAIAGAAVSWGERGAVDEPSVLAAADGETHPTDRGQDQPLPAAIEPAVIEPTLAAPVASRALAPAEPGPSEAARKRAAEIIAKALAGGFVTPDPDEKVPVLFSLHGDHELDPGRAERLGKLAECEAMVLPTNDLLVVAFDGAWDGHDEIRMDLVYDDVGRPEVVQCLRDAFAELGEQKRAEYPDHDEASENIVGAIFGDTPLMRAGRARRAGLGSTGADLSPDDLPLADESFPSRGRRDATVELVVCGDYDSRFTRDMAETLADLEAYYGADLRLRWLQAPLVVGTTSPLAKAAVAARDQGKFWELHARLMTHEGTADEAELLELAAAAGLDVPRFHAALAAPQTTAAVEHQLDTCRAHGARATPYFIIDGEGSVAGAVPFDRLASMIEAALERHAG